MQVIILLLILSPIEPSVPIIVPQPCWNALKDIAMVMELSGPRCPWVNNFRSEIQWVRKNWRECHDCPSIKDCQKLPSKEDCQRHLAVVQEYQKYLEVNKILRLHWVERLIEPTERATWLANFWRIAMEAMDESQNWANRRRALDKMRTLMGKEAYEAAMWPVPKIIDP